MDPDLATPRTPREECRFDLQFIEKLADRIGVAARLDISGGRVAATEARTVDADRPPPRTELPDHPVEKPVITEQRGP